jgi:hypothetical protein
MQMQMRNILRNQNISAQRPAFSRPQVSRVSAVTAVERNVSCCGQLKHLK